VLKNSQVDSLFTLLGSAPAKAAQRMLMKLTSGVNFTSILHRFLLKKIPKAQKYSDDVTAFVKASRKHMGVIDPC